ncbi:MAG: BMP family ABC transporter substrate-binding protein [Clostridiales bacterium]|nr:BMP family ABC transporter substrate-binding protein [Clostridiales bacterium]
MKNLYRILALLLCVIFLPLTASAASVADLNDGVTKIALLISGDLGDMSFWDSANAGLTKFAADHPDVVVDIIEMGSSDTTKYESTLTKTCNEAYDLIIVGSTDMREPLQRAAKKSKYSDRRFIIFDTEIKDGKAADYPTVHSIMFSQNEGGYLAGTLAALMSQEKGTAATAFVGGTKNDIINDFGFGFMQGVRDANVAKSINVGAYNAYIGDFVNSPKGSSLATSFYESGVEVLFAAASQAGLGCIDSAKNNGKLIIGVDSDQYAYYADTDPEKASHIVTSVLKRVDLALYECCEEFLAGTLTYGDLEVLGVKDGMIGLVENDNYNALVSEETRAYVADVTARIASGELVVQSGLKRYTKQDVLNELFDSLDPTK